MTTNSDDIDTDKKLGVGECICDPLQVEWTGRCPVHSVKPRVPIYEQPVPPEDDGVYKFNIGDFVQCETPAGYRILARVHKQGPDPISMVPSYQLQLIPESSFLFLSKEWLEAYGGRVGQ